jgi:Calcineurin-like phosphoesterase
MWPTNDPRRGDIEDDASSSERHSMLSLAGSLLAEISLPKLIVSWILLIGVPGLVLGLTPFAVSLWLSKLSTKASSLLAEFWAAIILVILLAVGWFGGRPFLRLAESSFWALNALAIQPGYIACREAMRHLFERRLSPQAPKAKRARLRAAAAIVAGAMISGIAIALLMIALPSSQLLGDIETLSSPKRLAIAAVANAVVLMCAYLATASLVWGVADATIAQPQDHEEFDTKDHGDRTWRIAHLSDIHVVGERFGFRIESGRSGPRGNERLKQVLAQLDKLHASEPLHAILITGDVTDAGRSAEWAEFFEAVDQYPSLAGLMLAIPGNHDLNIVDRANPARLDLPTSPNKRLRKIRVLSAMCAIQGTRVRIVERSKGQLGESLAAMLAPHLDNLAKFVDTGTPRLTLEPTKLLARAFPMVLPPERDNGLGIILLNSNDDTHFSFTNALGMISEDQMQGIKVATAQFPHACWLIALHHHIVEYPRAAKSLSERIGTALINGSWFLRRMQSLAGRAVFMHGHRHIDWIGFCAGLRIVSAPSPVMEATDDVHTCFYIHTLAIGRDLKLKLLPPQRVLIAGRQFP